MNGKKRLSSRVLAIILSVLMILQNIPATAFAAPNGYAGVVESNELWLAGGDAAEEVVSEDVEVMTEAETEPVSEQESEPETETETESELESETEEGSGLSLKQQIFVGYANGLIVRVIAPAETFPENTEMKVTYVGESQVLDTVSEVVDGEVKRLRAVDISFHADGQEIEPEKPVSVFINAPTMASDNGLSVVHIANSGAAEVVAEMSGTSTEFTSGEFSIYIVVETGDDARLTVNFVSGTETIASEMVNKSQINEVDTYIYDPGVGELNGNLFRGWTDNKDFTTETEPLTIQDVRNAVKAKLNAGVTDGESITYYAMIFGSYHISYRDEKNVSIKTDSVFHRLDDTSGIDYTVEFAYIPYANDSEDDPNATAEFMGWQQLDPAPEEVTVYENGTVISVNSDMILQAKVESGYWVTFNENGSGASYTEPQFVLKGGKAIEPEVPTRTGYRFDGWYTGAPSARGEDPTGERFNFNTVLTNQTTLYAKWVKNATAKYNVIIWRQNLAGDGYDWEESIELTGATDTAITTVTANGTGNNRYASVNGSAKRYTGFHLNEYDTGKTIAAEGTTVVNVYYDRNEHSLQFQVRSGNNWTTIKTITALYGQDISDNFPIVGNNGRTYDQGERWDPQNDSVWTEVMVFVDTMPDRNVTFHLNEANFATKTMNYYIEALPDATGTHTYNGKRYSLYNTVQAKYNGVTEEDYLDLNGFAKEAVADADGNTLSPISVQNSPEFYRRNRNSNPATTVNFYYSRNKYSITYWDGAYFDDKGRPISESSMGHLHTASDIPYESNISSYETSYKPSRDGYIFDGWYDDNTCTQPAVFDKMPLDGKRVYAKWTQKEFMIYLHGMDEDDPSDPCQYTDPTQSTQFDVPTGSTVGNVGGTRNYYDLVGWYTDSNYKHLYDFDSYIVNDSTVSKYGTLYNAPQGHIAGELHLYAKWRSKLDGAFGIQVVYDVGDSDSQCTDPLHYTDLAEAVATQAAVPRDDKQQFLYWVVQRWNGSAYEDTSIEVFPGDTYTIKKADAKVEDLAEPTDTGETKSYTIQLRAEYGPIGEPTLTHIYWYDNFGGVVDTNENLKINEAVPVPAAPTRSGYTFKGWVRDVENTETKTTSSTELFIKYENGAYNHTHVAADENWAVPEQNQYHAMYALWEENEVTINYAVAASDDGRGSVSSASETVKAVTGTAAGSTATANDNYQFAYWTRDNGAEAVSTNAAFVPSKETVDGTSQYVAATYYAHFNVKYTIHHYLKGTTTSVKDDVVGYVPLNESVAIEYATEYEGKTLSHDVDGNPESPVQITTAGQEVTVYYTLPLSIEVGDKTVTYNGSKQYGYGAADTAQITIDALDADKSSISFVYTPASGTDVGTYDNGKFGEVTAPEYYTINTLTAGKLIINPNQEEYEITVTGNSDTKVYNASEQSVSGYTVSEYDSTITFTGIAQDDAKATAKGTNVGTYTMTMSEADFSATSDNYTNIKITVVPGTLKITPVTDEYEIIVTGNSDTKVYNTSEQSVSGYTVSEYDSTITFTGIAQDDAKATAKGTNVGTYTMTMTKDDFTATSDNYTNIKITVVPGELEITPITDEYEITVTGNSDTKVYNTSEQSVSGYTVSEYDSTITFTGIEQDDAKATAKGTDVGTYTMTMTKDDFTATSDNYTNIKITVVPGTLEITPVDEYVITVTGNSDTKVYNTSEQSVNGYTYSKYDDTITITKELAQDDAKATAKGTNVGTYTMTMAAEDFAATSENYSKITFIVVPGTLTITPIEDEYEITVTGNSDSKVYNGEEQKVTGYTVSEYDSTITFTGIAQDNEKATAKGTDVGSYTMTMTKDDFTATSENYTNIKITVVPGTLEITPLTDKVTVTITENSGSEKYDGSEKTVTGYTVSIDNKLYTEADFTFSGNDTVKGTDAGSYPMELKPEDFTNTSKNFTNVEFVIVDGTLEIAKRTVTLTSADDEKVYDGKALTNDEVTVSGDGFAEGEGATYNVTGTQTEVGNSKNTFTYTLNEGTKADNYTITTVEGTLTVTELTDKVTVTITENSGSEKYDGTEKIVTGYTVSIDNELYKESDFTFSGDATVKGTDAGSYPMELKPEDFTNISKNFSNVEFVIVDGTLEIAKRTVTLTSADDKKVYDGTALTNDEVTVSGDGFVEGEGASYDVTGTQTLVGSSDNTFTYTLNEGTKADNYDITKVEGTLTVTDGTNPDDEKEVDDNLVVTKTAENKEYALGDKVTFTITATNIYDGPRTITLTEIPGVVLAQSVYENVAAGGTITAEATYTITEADILKGSFTNTVTAEVGNLSKQATATVKTEKKNPSLVVTKVSDVAEGTKVKLGKTITYTITVKNNGNVTISDIKLTDTIAGYEPEDITKELGKTELKPGEETTATFKHVVTEQDILAGNVHNEATADGSDPEGDKPNPEPGKTDDEPDDIDTTLEVVKKITNAPADGKAFKLGETIEYSITATNKGNVTYHNVVINDDLTGASKTIAELGIGQSESLTTSYVVTEADILKKEVKNTATAKGDPIPDPKNPDNPKVPEGEDSVTTGDETDPDNPPPIEDKNPSLAVTKVSDIAKGTKVKLGETITYTITVENDGNVTISDIKLTDTVAGYEPADITANLDKTTLAPGEKAVATFTHVVTEQDILAGSVKNEATADGIDPEGDKPNPEPGKTDDEPDDIDTTLTVNKKISNAPADGVAYKLGETIEYTITVKNEGNVTYKNVEVNDASTGFSTTIASLAVGAEETFSTSHVVTEEDILAGSYTNTVTAKGDPIPDPKTGEDKIPEGEDSTTTGDQDDPDGPNPPIVDPNPHLTVVKETTSETPAAGYALGDTVSYKITVKDDGNLTIKDIKVTDERTGLAESIEQLAPGESKEYTTSTTVTEEDILSGHILNDATATGIGPDPEKEVPVTPGHTDDEPEDPKPHLTITKLTTSTPSNGSTYALDETISYQIIAENDGNLTLTNVKVDDELTGDSWTVDSMAPGERRTFTTEYTVTSEDILKGSVLNVATADADGPGGNKPDPTPGTKEDPTDPINTSMTVVKTVTSTPAEGDEYALGETVEFQIVVTNTGNVPYNNIVVEDELTGDSWTIATLAVGASQTFTTSYVVTADDAEAGSFTNIAVATADPIPDPKDPTNPKVPGNRGDVEVPTTDETIGGDTNYYDLIIRYFDEDGNPILTDKTYKANLKEGTEYSVKSPNYKGFTPDQDVVAGTLTEDTIIDVIYSRNSYTLTIRYVDMNGNVNATRYRKVFLYGDRYSVRSPQIAGYEASRAVVSGTMPARDVQVTVRYAAQNQPVQELETIEDYGTPLGLGNLVQNAGDCFE